MTTMRRRLAALAAGAFVGLGVACGTAETTDAVDPAPPANQPTEAGVLKSEVESLLEETRLPGLVVALAEGGHEPLVVVAGHSDTDRMIPLDPDTPFFIGSISKNVFAVIALQLAEEGILGLDDPLSDYVQWPRGDEITIRMLMNHTSGVPDYFKLLSLLGSGEGPPDFFLAPHPPSEIIRMMPGRGPIFDPGTQQRYSNTNGLLVGRVIEKVTGKSLGEVLDERIVSPLGLENTYLYDETTIDRPRARGYCGMPGWATVPGELVDCSFADEALIDSADGSIVSSAGDLLRYHQALRGGELLEESSWGAMRSVESGLDNGLAYLIMSGPLGDHEGNVGRAIGHVAASVYYLELDLFVVMMLNRGDAPLPLRRFLEQRYGPE